MPYLAEALDEIRDWSRHTRDVGRHFERLFQQALNLHGGALGQRFDAVWLWSEWDGRDGMDRGIDLVARERDGNGFCAIQCKCYAADRIVAKRDIDSFVAASDQDVFTSRLVVNTGKAIAVTAQKTLDNSPKHCTVLDWTDLDAWIEDWRRPLAELRPQPRPRYTPHPYQADAVRQVITAFGCHDRGQLILPCGTGKTVVALWIAERMTGAGDRVLYLVPSIALMAQTMQVWAEQRDRPHRYIGICADTRVGRTDEDVSRLELAIPVTTDQARITAALRQDAPDALTVVFCTYQSLPRVEDAQQAGAPEFDLVICDEAHRTTGVEQVNPEGERLVSPFQLIHRGDRIRVRKRLYATATPRLYTDSAKGKAADQRQDLFSMDDPTVYGPEFYRMAFSEAIENGWLADYRVVILTLDAARHADRLQSLLVLDDGTEMNLEDAVRLLGCWDALGDPEGEAADRRLTGDRHNPLHRAISFTRTIKQSRLVEKAWGAVMAFMRAHTAENLRTELLDCAVRHVDGATNSLDRTRQLAWLREGDADACRVLTNARCLTEGVDVPALDAVLFMHPRRSQVDVVQAVGRVMRQAPGKQFGYIILPVVVTPTDDPTRVLEQDSAFKVVWDVLRALRSHDDRLDMEINALDLNQKRPERIIVVDGNGTGGDKDPAPDLQLPLNLIYEVPHGAIYAKVVEKCGDRKYWPQWATDVAQIAERIRARVQALLADPDRPAVQERFAAFLSDLRRTLHRQLTAADVVAMVAQHLVTGPVFQALFAGYDFVGCNPVAQALTRLVDLLEDTGLQHELRDLEPFYESVRRRARALDNAAARQQVLMELYENFFRLALKKDAERLGIVYTPVEVVDFLLHSADQALRQHFGRRLTGENVHILDPFTGTGTFIARLLQNPDLIQYGDLLRKFQSEVHANEIVLLAYYIAAINIEETLHGRLDPAAPYRPFDGMVFTDTFNLGEEEGQLPYMLAENSERVAWQRHRDITVIVGNPPYSAGQKSAADDNPNVEYPHLAQRVRETYAAHSTTTNRRHLYDSYKLALRWASDRIGAEGVIALVTNGSFIDGNADAGLRHCLAAEFSHVYVFNLRGNIRASGELGKREGGNVFAQGTRTPVAILVLVRDPVYEGPCWIRYKDIGDYLSRAAKLRIVQETGSIAGIEDWQPIVPDAHDDWLNQRDPAYQRFMPLGSKEAKMQKEKILIPEVAARIYSSGVKTGSDPWLYAFDVKCLHQRAQNMIDFYENTRSRVQREEVSLHDATRNIFPTEFTWDRERKKRLARNREIHFDAYQLREAMYRPFVKQRLYYEPLLIQMIYQVPKMFPTPDAPNQVIGVPGKGQLSRSRPSVFMTDVIPDMQVIFNGQWFPRYRYEEWDPHAPAAWTQTDDSAFESVPGYRRVDNITDWCLQQFRDQYPKAQIDKDDIWLYLYGVLHARDYRDKYRSDLAKDLPRIPFAPDFGAFRDAGQILADLHLHYETGPAYDLPVEIKGEDDESVYRLGRRPMPWGKKAAEVDKSVLQVTPQVTLRDIPEAAHAYIVNGRSPLDWARDRLYIRQDKISGIINDPNAWFADNPAGLVTHLQRLIHVSVATVHILKSLPSALPR